MKFVYPSYQGSDADYVDAWRKLKASTGWEDGTDEFGFSALPGGIGYVFSDGGFGFIEVGGAGFWWGSSEGEDVSEAYNIGAYNGDGWGGSRNKLQLSSVRCLKD